MVRYSREQATLTIFINKCWFEYCQHGILLCMWKLVLLVAGHILRSFATVLLVVPILILFLDVLLVSLPVFNFGLSVSSVGIQDWFTGRFSLREVAYQIIAFLGVFGIALEFFFPNVKIWIVKLLSDQDKIFYLFLVGMITSCVALFLYTWPSFIASGWPYGSKKGLISVVGFMGVIHLFGLRWLFVYVALDRGATKLINKNSSNIIP